MTLQDTPLNRLQREARRAKSSRAEVAEGAARVQEADLPGAGMAGRWRFVRDFMDGVFMFDNGNEWKAFNQLPVVAYAALPATVSDGVLVYVSDGRKNGEGAGAGTGVTAYSSNNVWYRFSDDTAVST